MGLESSKTLGGIGALVFVVTTLASLAEPLAAIVGVVGIILILLALHGLADYFKERGIFNNALYGFLALIVGGIATFVVFVYLFFATSFGTNLISLLYPGFNGNWATLPNLTPNMNVDPVALVPYVGPIIGLLAILWIFGIVTSFFMWRSLKGLSVKSSVGLFSTAGLVMLIGALLSVVIIGLALVWIAVLLMAFAFFQLKPIAEPVSAPTPNPPPAPQPTTI
jgi:uncharacterized membrane protein